MINNISEHFVDFIDVFSSKGRSKIVKLLAIKNEMNITQIVKITRLNHGVVQKHLSFLSNSEIILEKRFGKIRIYKFNIENIKAKALQNLILFWENVDDF